MDSSAKNQTRIQRNMDKIRALLEDVDIKSATVAGSKVDYVQHSVLREMTTLMEETVKECTPVNSKEVSKLRDEVDKLKSNLVNIKEEKTALAKTMNKQKETFNSLEKKHHNLVSQLKDTIDEAAKRERALEEHMEAQMVKLAAIRDESGKPEVKWDPDATKAWKDKLETAEKDLAEMTVERDQYRNEIKNHRNKLDESAKELAQAKEQLREANTSLGQMSNLDKLRKAGHDIPDRVIEMHPMIDSLLGKNAMSWLQKLDKVNRLDLRERAYHALRVAQQADSKQVSAFKVLLQHFLDVVKKGAGRAYTLLEAWFTELENDLRKFKLQPLSYYREKLEQILSNLKDKADKKVKSIAKQHKEYKKKSRTYRDFFTFVASATKPARNFLAKTVAAVKPVFTSAKAATQRFFSKVRAIFKLPVAPEGSTEEILHDANEFEPIHMDEKDAEDTDTPESAGVD